MDIDFIKSDQMETMLMHLPDFDDNNINPIFNVHSPTSFDNMNHFHAYPTPLPAGPHRDASVAFFSTYPGGGGGERNSSSSNNDNNSNSNNSMAAMREMIFRIAAMQPVQVDPEVVKRPRRKNVRISTDPQSVAARHRRERISERIRILQRLVPGGTKMDTASMLDEAIHYVKFLKSQVQSLERVAPPQPRVGFPVPMSSGTYFPAAAGKGYCEFPTTPHRNVEY